MRLKFWKKSLEYLLAEKPKIRAKKRLAKDTILFKIRAPLVAKKAKPGQFVTIMTGENGETIPLTIADSNPKKLFPKRGTIDLIFKELGKTTKQLGKFRKGDELYALKGPLGVPAEIKKYDGAVVCVGGGIGTAPVYPEAKAHKLAGNKVISIIGAKTASELILEKEMGKVSNELYIATDDGSKGYHGFVTGVLEEVLKKAEVSKVIAIGPVPMMANCAKVAEKYGVPKMAVSLNSIMVDGTGMCGGCRVQVRGQSKYACCDGPRFNGYEVDFSDLSNRQKQYLEQEKTSLEKYKRECKCQKR